MFGGKGNRMIFHSGFEYNYLWMPLIGFVVGLVATIIGSGGSFFFLLALMLLFDVSAPVAVTTSLAATVPICIVGTAGHYRHGHINFRIGLIFIATGVFGAVLGANLTGLLSPEKLKIAFGIYIILLALQMLVDHWRTKKKTTKKFLQGQKVGTKKVASGSVYGFLSGVITGTFGTSGAAPVLAGLFSMRIPVKEIAGTSLAIILVNTIFALTAHFLVGKIDLTLVYFLAAGATVGAFAGPKLLAGFKISKSDSSLRVWYALLLVAMGIVIIMSK